MSSRASAAITKLPAPVRELVQKVAKELGDLAFGKSEKDFVEAEQWIERAADSSLVTQESLRTLDSHLVSKTYLVNNSLTAADISIYGALHDTISKESPSAYYNHPSVTRFFDHIQHREQVRTIATSLSPPFQLVEFDLANAPKPAPKPETVAVAKQSSPAPAVDVTLSTQAQPKKEGKEPKEKSAKKKNTGASAEGAKKASGKNAAASPSAAPESSTPIPSMIDLRVGHIVDVHKHPDADGLYVEQIDLGEETGPRTVVSGLVNYIPIEQMRDKWLVAVCNLKPANMRGVKSSAMVLCATSKDGKEGGIEIIDPPKGSKPGERVYFEGEFENGLPLEQLNPKKKIFEAIQPGFATLESREAAWRDPATQTVHRIRTKDGVCTAPTLVGATLS